MVPSEPAECGLVSFLVQKAAQDGGRLPRPERTTAGDAVFRPPPLVKFHVKHPINEAHTAAVLDEENMHL